MNIPDLSNTRIIVAGDLMLDSYWFGSTSRISPEAPVPVAHINRAEERPGGAGNVAMNLAALGGHVELAGITGNDDAAVRLEGILTGQGIDCHLKRLDSAPTINKYRVISKNQQLIRMDIEQEYDSSINEILCNNLQAQAGNCSALVLSDYGKGTLSNLQDIIRLARKLDIPVLIEPKGKDYSKYAGASLITPNLTEFELVAGDCSNDDALSVQGVNFLEEYNIDTALVTRGEQGMTLLQRGQASIHIPTRIKEVFDVTGAGDTVIAVMAACIAAGSDLETAARASNLAAGLAVSKLGATSITAAELHAAADDKVNTSGKVLPESSLLEQVKKAQQSGERIVMTNGCFDILHAGHINYLEQATELGSKLIVAVNDDSSVTRLKGESRPIHKLADRMRILAALECVDWVVSFSEDTPLRIIEAVIPDVLVKGGDYVAEEIVGYDCVTKNGGKVEVLTFIDGQSTSDLLVRIKQQD